MASGPAIVSPERQDPVVLLNGNYPEEIVLDPTSPNAWPGDEPSSPPGEFEFVIASPEKSDPEPGKSRALRKQAQRFRSPALPNSYELDQSVFSFRTSFDVVNEAGSYGTVFSDILFVAPTFYFENNDGKVMAWASAQPGIGPTVINVIDENNRFLGEIREKILQSLGPVSCYEIRDAQGRLVATSDKFQAFDTTFTIRDHQGKTIAVMNRGIGNFTGDTWTVSVSPSSAVDERILLMVAPFKTVADQASKKTGSRSILKSSDSED